MADKINLRAEEYHAIQAELRRMHEIQIQTIGEVIEELKALVTNEDAFKADQTSNKMEDMLKVLSVNTADLLQEVFDTSEAGIANMIDTVTITDTACKK